MPAPQTMINVPKMEGMMSAKGLTNKTLAEQLGRTKQGIDYILEEGRTKWRTLGEIAKVLGVSRHDLLNED